MFLRAVPIGVDRGSPRAVLTADLDHDTDAHDADSHAHEPAVIPKGTGALGRNQ